MRVNEDSSGKSKRNCHGCLFFVSCICVVLQSKSKEFYLFNSHSRDRFGRVTSQGTSVLPKFSCIKSVVSYIFDTYAKLLRTGPYEIQHMAILHLGNKARLRKNTIQNLVRSHKMKACRSFDERQRSSSIGRIGIVQGSFQRKYLTVPSYC